MASSSGTYFSHSEHLVSSLLSLWPHSPCEQSPSILLCGPSGNGKSYLVQRAVDRVSLLSSHTLIDVRPSVAQAVTVRQKDGTTGFRKQLRRCIVEACRTKKQGNSGRGDGADKDGAQSVLTRTVAVILDHMEFFISDDSNAAAARTADSDDGSRYGTPTHPMLMADLFSVLRNSPPLFSEDECAALRVDRMVFLSLFSGVQEDVHALMREKAFDIILALPTPTEKERLAFFHDQIRTASPDDTTSMHALHEALAYRSGGVTYRGLMEIASSARHLLREDKDAQLHHDEVQSVLARQALHAFHHGSSTAALEYRRSGGYVDVQTTRWADIAGMAHVKEQLQQLVLKPLHFQRFYKHAGVRPSTGILFYGPPGTGKTMLAKAMATELNASFVYMDLPELVQCEVGESEKKLKQFFAVARERSPTVMFIDELQAAFGVRYGGGGGNSGSAHDARLVSYLLHQLDESQADEEHFILFVGATNVKEMLDPLLLRPGRMDTQIEVPLPDAEARLYLVKRIVCEDWARWLSSTTSGSSQGMLPDPSRQAIQSILIKALVEATTGMSGAAIRNATSVFALKLVQAIMKRKSTSSSYHQRISPWDFAEALVGIDALCPNTGDESLSGLELKGEVLSILRTVIPQKAN